MFFKTNTSLDRYKQKKMLRGINKVANVLRKTLGPIGSNVIIDNGYSPIILNDGYFIAKNFVLENELEHLGAKLLIDASIKTNDDVGDGTTTVAIIASSMLNGIFKLMKHGKNRLQIKKTLDLIHNEIFQIVERFSETNITLDKIYYIARTAGKSEFIGDMIRTIYQKYGIAASIFLEEATTSETKYFLEKGMRINRGFLSEYMVKNYKTKIINYHDVTVVLIIGGYDLDEILNLSFQSLLIVFNRNISLDELHKLNEYIITHEKQVVAIKEDINKDILDDLKVMCAMTSYKQYFIGHADEIKVSRNKTTIIASNDVSDYINILKEEYLKANELYKPQIKNRIASIADSVVKVVIGGDSEVEIKEKKYHFEDALLATEAAIDSGIMLGEGIAYLVIADELKRIFNKQLKGLEKKVFNAVYQSLNQPYKIIVGKRKKNKLYYDFQSDAYISQEDFKVYDPAKVVETVLNNAFSVVSLFSTIEQTMILNVPKNFEL